METSVRIVVVRDKNLGRHKSEHTSGKKLKYSVPLVSPREICGAIRASLGQAFLQALQLSAVSIIP